MVRIKVFGRVPDDPTLRNRWTAARGGQNGNGRELWTEGNWVNERGTAQKHYEKTRRRTEKDLQICAPEWEWAKL